MSPKGVPQAHGRGAYARDSQPVAKDVLDTVMRAVERHGWAKVYRKAGVGETSIRRAMDGLPVAPVTASRLTAYVLTQLQAEQS